MISFPAGISLRSKFVPTWHEFSMMSFLHLPLRPKLGRSELLANLARSCKPVDFPGFLGDEKFFFHFIPTRDEVNFCLTWGEVRRPIRTSHYRTSDFSVRRHSFSTSRQVVVKLHFGIIGRVSLRRTFLSAVHHAFESNHSFASKKAPIFHDAFCEC